ncbi:hypothetical protein GGR56DRAFT_133298 [Xylariaceae sp. FL0804]|nr:hypothetical protein GGR56DRAFT_133298 [Xylariaceae sp. FL0804]
MASSPHIVAELHLPTTLSFTSGPEPQLKLTLTLVGSPHPVTISKDNPHVFTPMNAFTITEVPGGRPIETATVDKCYRFGPPRLDAEHLDRFLTLEPGVPCDVFQIGFRPLGPQRNRPGEPARPADSPDDKYRRKYAFLGSGMHWLEPGKQYLVRARQGAIIAPWRWGRREDLMPRDWLGTDGDALEVVSAEGVQVQVQE